MSIIEGMNDIAKDDLLLEVRDLKSIFRSSLAHFASAPAR